MAAKPVKKQSFRQVAKVFGIGHQSPQVLVIRAGRVTAHASHGGIDGLRPKAV